MSDVHNLQEALSDFAELAGQREETPGGFVGPATAVALVGEGVAEFSEDRTRIVLNVGTSLKIFY